MKLRTGIFLPVFFFTQVVGAQKSYPQNYFRDPLGIPMQLVANFGEIRANHWHMGLDIRTHQKVNLPVYAAADGYIARVSIEPGGFGQAIYINHPNGYTTLYGHLNAFFPALAEYVKKQQYAQESWKVNIMVPADLFPVKKGEFIALSGSTGASEGPHVHFEIRNTKTENCLNPLLFNFPIADNVPPSIYKLAIYDRNKSTYEQSPQVFGVKRNGSVYTLATSVHVGSDKISFAIGAADHISGSLNPNGIFSAKVFMDDKPISGFVLNNISYSVTRYINAQIDYPYKARGGAPLQHITPLPGAQNVVYNLFDEDGIIHLKDKGQHLIRIELKDANNNSSNLEFIIQYDERLAKAYPSETRQRFLPNNVNVFEENNFELYTSELSIYDSITVSYSATDNKVASSASPLFAFLSAAIPSHDSVTVRIKPSEIISAEWRNRAVIKNISGNKIVVEKAEWQNGWYAAKFRQFGTFQLFIDKEAPSINLASTNLSKASRLVFIPHDNFNTIKNFRAELDGHWLRFSNDKGHSWIYSFDEYFPKGDHELKVMIEDEAGNMVTKIWKVRR